MNKKFFKIKAPGCIHYGKIPKPICDFIIERAVDYEMWINEDGIFCIDEKTGELISQNQFRAILRRDILQCSATELRGTQLQKCLVICLDSVVRAYVDEIKRRKEL